jgi:signal peptidase I
MSKVLVLSIAVALSAVLHPAQEPTYVKGDIVRLAPPTTGDRYPDCRVIAVAGDRIRAQRSGIVVNGEPVEDVSPQMLELFAETWEEVVPAGHYFVIGESHEPSSTVRYHGLIPSEKIVRKVK